jgi:hypothetical protein
MGNREKAKPRVSKCPPMPALPDSAAGGLDTLREVTRASARPDLGMVTGHG